MLLLPLDKLSYFSADIKTIKLAWGQFLHLPVYVVANIFPSLSSKLLWWCWKWNSCIFHWTIFAFYPIRFACSICSLLRSSSLSCRFSSCTWCWKQSVFSMLSTTSLATSIPLASFSLTLFSFSWCFKFVLLALHRNFTPAFISMRDNCIFPFTFSIKPQHVQCLES